MKEIWINLELYIKRYDFYKLRNFSGFLNYFYYFIFDFKPIFLNKKYKKWARLRGMYIVYIIYLLNIDKEIFILRLGKGY